MHQVWFQEQPLNQVSNLVKICLAYTAVAPTELLNTANKLLLTASVGENPINVSTGTIIIPPPKPIIDPNIPAINPKGINQISSNILSHS